MRSKHSPGIPVSGHFPFVGNAHIDYASGMGKATTKHGTLELIARDVRPDARRRVTLGKALEGLDADAAFAVYRDELGRIILDPQVSIPAREAWLFRNPKALAMVRRGLQDAADGKTVTYRDVAALADDVES